MHLNKLLPFILLLSGTVATAAFAANPVHSKNLKVSANWTSNGPDDVKTVTGSLNHFHEVTVIPEGSYYDSQSSQPLNDINFTCNGITKVFKAGSGMTTCWTNSDVTWAAVNANYPAMGSVTVE